MGRANDRRRPPRRWVTRVGLVAVVVAMAATTAVAPSASARGGVEPEPVTAAAAAAAAAAPELLPDDAGQIETAAAPSITIVADSVPNDGQDFAFSGCNGMGCSPFSLDDDADPTLPSTVSADGLPAGDYVISQTGVANWATSIFCTEAEDVDNANRTVTITLTAGEDVTCTFTNESASITIAESTIPDSPQDFSFTGCQGSGCSSFSLDDDHADGALPRSVTGAGLAPGTYVITQDALPARWSLETISCTPAQQLAVQNRQVTITLTAGTQVTCSFENKSQAIQIVQDTDPDGGQDIGYVGCMGVACAPFTLDDDADPTQPRSVLATGLATGTYSIIQDEVPGLTLTDIECSGFVTFPEPWVTTAPHVIDGNARRVTTTLTDEKDLTCTFTNIPTPGNLVGVAQLAAGEAHTCAVFVDTTAACWGANNGGQLGSVHHSSDPWRYPTQVRNVTDTGPLTGVVEVAPGSAHTCARTTDGSAYCWGSLPGVGSPGRVDHAVQVLEGAGGDPLSDVVDITSGRDFSCAVTSTGGGTAYCWGDDIGGQLGNGASSGSQYPSVVVDTNGTGALANVAQVSAGGQGELRDHACARSHTGAAWCWGNNDNGAIGDGTVTDRPSPTPVVGVGGTGLLTGVADLSVWADQSCAVLDTGQARCWGAGAAQPGDTTTPAIVKNAGGAGPLSNLAAISVGHDTVCARATDGAAWCWGEGSQGQVGDGTASDRTLPVIVVDTSGAGSLSGVAEISSRGSHTCALVPGLQARCWGDNASGQLGDTTVFARSVPVPVRNPPA